MVAVVVGSCRSRRLDPNARLVARAHSPSPFMLIIRGATSKGERRGASGLMQRNTPLGWMGPGINEYYCREPGNKKSDATPLPAARGGYERVKEGA